MAIEMIYLRLRNLLDNMGLPQELNTSVYEVNTICIEWGNHRSTTSLADENGPNTLTSARTLHMKRTRTITCVSSRSIPLISWRVFHQGLTTGAVHRACSTSRHSQCPCKDLRSLEMHSFLATPEGGRAISSSQDESREPFARVFASKYVGKARANINLFASAASRPRDHGPWAREAGGCAHLSPLGLRGTERQWTLVVMMATFFLLFRLFPTFP
jgi:hypothetical protein